MQLIAQKEILIAVVSPVVHCCVIKKNVIVASQLYDVADVQFIVEKESPLELLKFIQKYNLGNSVPDVVIMLRIFLTITVSVLLVSRAGAKSLGPPPRTWTLGPPIYNTLHLTHTSYINKNIDLF